MKKHTRPTLTPPERCQKVSYSFAGAHLAINLARMPNWMCVKRSKKIPRRAYRCPYCHTWHLTSKRFDKSHDN